MDMVDPQPTLGDLLVRYVLLPRELLPQIEINSNERWLEVFMKKLALDPTWVKNHACYDELRTYGTIAA